MVLPFWLLPIDSVPWPTLIAYWFSGTGKSPSTIRRGTCGIVVSGKGYSGECVRTVGMSTHYVSFV